MFVKVFMGLFFLEKLAEFSWCEKCYEKWREEGSIYRQSGGTILSARMRFWRL